MQEKVEDKYVDIGMHLVILLFNRFDSIGVLFLDFVVLLLKEIIIVAYFSSYRKGRAKTS